MTEARIEALYSFPGILDISLKKYFDIYEVLIGVNHPEKGIVIIDTITLGGGIDLETAMKEYREIIARFT